MLYGVWYGLERMVVEGMRTDSLYIANTTLRVSQVLSMVIVVVFAAGLIVNFVRLKKGTLPKRLAVDVIKNNEKTDENSNEGNQVTASVNNEKAEEENGTDN